LVCSRCAGGSNGLHETWRNEKWFAHGEEVFETVCSMGIIDQKQFALGLLTVYEIQDRFALER
jgi:hypothetical protein